MLAASWLSKEFPEERKRGKGKGGREKGKMEKGKKGKRKRKRKRKEDEKQASKRKMTGRGGERVTLGLSSISPRVPDLLRQEVKPEVPG